jgi:hypothetical protein
MRRCAKRFKNELKPHLKKMWCIPPKQSAEFVYYTEDVLEPYKQPYDPGGLSYAWIKRPGKA